MPFHEIPKKASHIICQFPLTYWKVFPLFPVFMQININLYCTINLYSSCELHLWKRNGFFHPGISPPHQIRDFFIFKYWQLSNFFNIKVSIKKLSFLLKGISCSKKDFTVAKMCCWTFFFLFFAKSKLRRLKYRNEFSFEKGSIIFKLSKWNFQTKTWTAKLCFYFFKALWEALRM